MKQVLCIADDFGADDATNEAIVHSHRHGALAGAALMMGQPGTAGAVELAGRSPTLQVGWHLHLCDSRPLTQEAWPWGASPARAGFAIGFSARARTLARREIREQWAAFRATGLPCRFVNSHHHIHVHPFVLRALVETLGEAFGGWLRWGRPRFFDRGRGDLLHRGVWLLLQAPRRRTLPFRLSTTAWGIDRTFRMNPAEVARVLPDLGEGLHEFIFHPRHRAGRSGPADPDTRCLEELAGVLGAGAGSS